MLIIQQNTNPKSFVGGIQCRIICFSLGLHAPQKNGFPVQLARGTHTQQKTMMIIIKKNSYGVCYGTILNGGPWTHELHICKLPQATSQYSSAHLFSKKSKSRMKKKLLPQSIKKQKENVKQKKKRLFCPCCHHTHLPMPHIKQACLQTTDYKSQTTTNCNPEMSIRTCICM